MLLSEGVGHPDVEEKFRKLKKYLGKNRHDGQTKATLRASLIEMFSEARIKGGTQMIDAAIGGDREQGDPSKDSEE